MINFNIPLITGNEIKYLKEAIKNGRFSGDGLFTGKCNHWLENKIKTKKALLTTSCTHALEIAAILSRIKSGDEVIMPSFTFVSTANAFVLRGAKVVFVDIRPDTMNIDENKIEKAITAKTKAIVCVHYAGVSCDMDVIMEIATKHRLLVIEDAAQGIMASYKGRALGSIGDIGCLSFHETKNYHCGEGGAALINNEKFIDRVEIIREKGTNRKQFLQGRICKYTWIDIGSSYLPSELNASFLYAHLKKAEEVNKKRQLLWNEYYKNLKRLKEDGFLQLPHIPAYCKHNAHAFYIKLRNVKKREEMISFLKQKNIQTTFHYIPLHSSLAGRKFGRFFGKDMYTTKESQRILRLPLYFNLNLSQVKYISKQIIKFYYG